MNNRRRATDYDVPRETWQKLSIYEGLVSKWSTTINLVARNSLADIRMRHIEDSIFIAQRCSGTSRWLDLGSGAGFPGLVVAILYNEMREVILVECDRRKAEFLRVVKRELALDVNIISERAENIVNQEAGIISARALAPLPKLLDLCYLHSSHPTKLILPKGRNWAQEVDVSHLRWSYDLNVVNNPAAEGSVVLEISDLRKVER